jgi:hypothetical protein
MKKSILFFVAVFFVLSGCRMGPAEQWIGDATVECWQPSGWDEIAVQVDEKLAMLGEIKIAECSKECGDDLPCYGECTNRIATVLDHWCLIYHPQHGAESCDTLDDLVFYP